MLLSDQSSPSPSPPSPHPPLPHSYVSVKNAAACYQNLTGKAVKPSFLQKYRFFLDGSRDTGLQFSRLLPGLRFPCRMLLLDDVLKVRERERNKESFSGGRGLCVRVSAFSYHSPLLSLFSPFLPLIIIARGTFSFVCSLS